MKRIDDKIKEIEKKDKNSRILYIIIVVLIAGFMAYALSSEKKIRQQGEIIVGQDKTIEEQLIEIKRKNDSLNDVVTRLQKSQTPIGFWDQTVAAHTTGTYIDYILHEGKPEAKDEYRMIALDTIDSETTEGKTVWLFIGRTNGDRIISDRVLDVIYRNGEDVPSKDVLPTPGDLVVNSTMNRNTYRRFSDGNVAGPNNDDKAWKKNIRAKILDVKTAGNAVFAEIKF